MFPQKDIRILDRYSCQLNTVGDVFPAFPQMWPGVLKSDAGVSGPAYTHCGVWFSR